MNRRSFLTLLGIAPVMPVAVQALPVAEPLVVDGAISTMELGVSQVTVPSFVVGDLVRWRDRDWRITALLDGKVESLWEVYPGDYGWPTGDTEVAARADDDLRKTITVRNDSGMVTGDRDFVADRLDFLDRGQALIS